jgi:hypothetical protein
MPLAPLAVVVAAVLLAVTRLARRPPTTGS